MTREILFRGRAMDGEKWHYGDLVRYAGQLRIKEETDDKGVWTVDPDTIGQYTGLNDKNGRKIFEGDVVTIPGSKKKGLPAEVRYMPHEARYCVRRNGYQPIPLDGADEWCEVVGNIFDDPELIGGQVRKWQERKN